MAYETGKAVELIVTTEMREAGAAILYDPDFSYSCEDKAEAVYIAMERSRLGQSNPGPHLRLSRQS